MPFPPNCSSAGTEKFLRWNRKVPPLELKSSTLGTKKFQKGNCFWNSYVLRGQRGTSGSDGGFALRTRLRSLLDETQSAVRLLTLHSVTRLLQQSRNVLSTDLSMNPWLTVALLVVSNVFMTFAWYGHIKLEQMRVITDHTPLYLVILLSWCLALFEYSFQIPANRYGYVGNGGAFSLMQLKVIQEVVSITVFTLFSVIFFRGEPLQWNHLAAFACLVLAVYFVFLK